MRCNTFDELMRDLHFVDDTNLSMDRYSKVRPLVEDLNGAGQKEQRSVIVTADAPGTDALYVTLHPDNIRWHATNTFQYNIPSHTSMVPGSFFPTSSWIFQYNY